MPPTRDGTIFFHESFTVIDLEASDDIYTHLFISHQNCTLSMQAID